jgi:hypothetical protein
MAALPVAVAIGKRRAALLSDIDSTPPVRSKTTRAAAPSSIAGRTRARPPYGQCSRPTTTT